MRRDDFTGPADLRDMQAMCSRLWSPEARFHPGQLAWNHITLDETVESQAISLWRVDGEVVGFGWAETSDWLELQVDPAFPGLAHEVVEWFEEWSDAPTQSAVAMDGDACEAALAEAGFEPEPTAWFLQHHLLDLAELPPVPSTPGYALRHVVPGEAAERAACHRLAWADFGSSAVSTAAYERLMAAFPYRVELDWVAVDARGAMVASALVWLDPATGVGLVEPVGCVPEHRGRGLAGAVTLAALERLQDLGGHAALVTPRGDDDYPGPRRLYQSLGFQPGTRTVTWTRSLD